MRVILKQSCFRSGHTFFLWGFTRYVSLPVAIDPLIIVTDRYLPAAHRYLSSTKLLLQITVAAHVLLLASTRTYRPLIVTCRY